MTNTAASSVAAVHEPPAHTSTLHRIRAAAAIRRTILRMVPSTSEQDDPRPIRNTCDATHTFAATPHAGCRREAHDGTLETAIRQGVVDGDPRGLARPQPRNRQQNWLRPPPRKPHRRGLPRLPRPNRIGKSNGNVRLLPSSRRLTLGRKRGLSNRRSPLRLKPWLWSPVHSQLSQPPLSRAAGPRYVSCDACPECPRQRYTPCPGGNTTTGAPIFT